MQYEVLMTSSFLASSYQSINQFSFIHDRNNIATLMFTNLSIIKQYNNVKSELIYVSIKALGDKVSVVF